MMMRSFAALGLLALLLCGCAGTARLASQPCQEPVEVDGQGDEWIGAVFPVEDQPLSLGARDDGENLYLVLVTASTQLQERILRQGLTLWFDGEGGKEKSSGIQYPVGMAAGGMANMRRGARGAEEQPDPEERAERLSRGFADMQGSLRFLAGEDDPGWTLERSELQGLELAYSLDAGRLIYEMKVPLREGPERSFSLGLADSGEVGLGLEIAAPEMTRARGGSGGGMGGDRGGGMGGGRGGGMGGGRGGGMGGGRGGGMGGPPEGMERPRGYGVLDEDRVKHRNPRLLRRESFAMTRTGSSLPALCYRLRRVSHFQRPENTLSQLRHVLRGILLPPLWAGGGHGPAAPRRASP